MSNYRQTLDLELFSTKSIEGDFGEIMKNIFNKEKTNHHNFLALHKTIKVKIFFNNTRKYLN